MFIIIYGDAYDLIEQFLDNRALDDDGFPFNDFQKGTRDYLATLYSPGTQKEATKEIGHE